MTDSVTDFKSALANLKARHRDIDVNQDDNSLVEFRSAQRLARTFFIKEFDITIEELNEISYG